jgi:uridine monophosphate synthetase
VHIRVAQLAAQWNTNDNLGLVVGATQPEALRQVRRAVPDMWFLAPGVGAQGGNLQAALAAGLRPDGLGMLIPVSRGISRAENPRRAAQALRQAINTERSAANRTGAAVGTPSQAAPDLEVQIAGGLLDLGCIQFGEFTLKSGVRSPIYIDLRRLTASPALLAQVARAYIPILEGLSFDHIAALPYAAMPIGTAISLLGGWSLIYPRKEVKAYGTQARVEGVYAPGERVVVIDDLISTGASKIEAIEKLTSAGLEVRDVVVLIDRRAEGHDQLAERGYRLRAVLPLPALLDIYQESGAVSAAKIAQVREFLAAGSGDG